METCIVAIHNIEHCDNYRHLPLCFTQDDVRVVIHHDPQRELRNGRWETNYDLLLDVGYDTELPHADFKSPRYSKFEQTAHLNDWALESKAKYFQPIPLYNKVLNVTRPHHLSDLPDQVLLKSADGARGVGHILYDTRKGSLFSFLTALKKPGTEHVPQVLEAHRQAIELHTGKYRSEEEIHSVLATQPLLVTKPLFNVTAELRVLLDHKHRVVLIKARSRLDNTSTQFNQQSGYLQATGADRTEDTRVTSLDAFCPQYAEEITAFLKLMPPMISVDLFFTETGWGVFEYCNQFGTEAFDIDESVQFHKGLITHLYRTKVKAIGYQYVFTVPNPPVLLKS